MGINTFWVILCLAVALTGVAIWRIIDAKDEVKRKDLIIWSAIMAVIGGSFVPLVNELLSAGEVTPDTVTFWMVLPVGVFSGIGLTVAGPAISWSINKWIRRKGDDE